MKKIYLLTFLLFSLSFVYSQELKVEKLHKWGGEKWDLPSIITVDDEQNVFLAGGFCDSMQVGSETLVSQGDRDIFLFELDSSSNVKWIKQFGGTDYNYVTCW